MPRMRLQRMAEAPRLLLCVVCAAWSASVLWTSTVLLVYLVCLVGTAPYKSRLLTWLDAWIHGLTLLLMAMGGLAFSADTADDSTEVWAFLAVFWVGISFPCGCLLWYALIAVATRWSCAKRRHAEWQRAWWDLKVREQGLLGGLSTGPRPSVYRLAVS